MDLLRIVVCLPSALILDITKNWYLGTPLCKAITFIEAFVIFVSELTLSYIAYDRWQCIQNPFQSSNSKSIQKPKMVIFSMWALAAVLALPEPLMSNVIYTTGDEPRIHSTIYNTTCTRDWSKETDVLYVIIKVIFSFCCPLFFTLVVYSKVIRYIWKEKALTPSQFFYGSTSRGRFNEPLPVRSLNRQWMRRFQRRKRAIHMLIAMTVVYNLGYFPLYVITIIKFFVVVKDDKLQMTMKMMAHWFCYATAAITPSIYGFMSVRFRAEFSHMCKSPTSYCCFCQNKSSKQNDLSSNLEETSDNQDKLQKPLIPLNRDIFCENVNVEITGVHKDLVSMPSTLSQVTHKTLSPMTSDTSISTNFTRSTNLSSDAEKVYSFDSNDVISEQGEVQVHTCPEQAVDISGLEIHAPGQVMESVEAENIIPIRKYSSQKNSDATFSQTICAQVHQSAIKENIVERDMSTNPYTKPTTLRRSISLHILPLQSIKEYDININSKLRTSFPIHKSASNIE